MKRLWFVVCFIVGTSLGSIKRKEKVDFYYPHYPLKHRCWDVPLLAYPDPFDKRKNRYPDSSDGAKRRKRLEDIENPSERTKKMKRYDDIVAKLRWDALLWEMMFGKLQNQVQKRLVKSQVKIADRLPSRYAYLFLNDYSADEVEKLFAETGTTCFAVGSLGGFYLGGFKSYVKKIFKEHDALLDKQYIDWLSVGGGEDAFWRIIRESHIKNFFESLEGSVEDMAICGL